MGLSISIPFLVCMNEVNLVLRNDWFMVTVAMPVFLRVSVVVVNRLLLLPLLVLVSSMTDALLSVRLLLLSTLVVTRVVVRVVTCTSGMFPLSRGCLTVWIALELQVSRSSSL